MQFFNWKDLARSWSVWALGAVTVTPVIDTTTGLFSFLPDQYKPLAVTVLGLVGLFVRAVKQVKTFGK